MVNNNYDNMTGRRDRVDVVKTTSLTISGVTKPLPLVPLERRNYIYVQNVGANDAVILDSLTTNSGQGVVLAKNGGSWFEFTNAPLFIASTSTGATTIKVYERASREMKR